MMAWLRAVMVALTFLTASTATAQTALLLHPSAATLDFVDPGSGVRLAALPLGGDAIGLTVAPDGSLAIAALRQSDEHPEPSLAILELVQPRVRGRLPLTLPAPPSGIAWFDDSRVAVLSGTAQRVWLVDWRSATVSSEIPVDATGMDRIAAGAGTGLLYLGATATGRITAIDVAGGRAPAAAQLEAGLNDLSVTPSGHYVWVAPKSPGSITLLDPWSLRPAGRITVPGEALRIAMAPDGRHAFVLCSTAGVLRLLRIDTSSFAVQQTAVVPAEPAALAATPILPRAECHACKAGAILK
jgi:hypothetical protein